MNVPLRYFLFFLMAGICFACKNPPSSKKKNGVDSLSKISLDKKNDSFRLGISIPAESCNDDETKTDTNFTLKDLLGKRCIPFFDTIKGGGYSEYRLPPGVYTYSVRTIFNERFTESFHLRRDTNIYLSTTAFYPQVDTLFLEDITNADSLKIAFIEEDNLDFDLYKAYKRPGRYHVRLFTGRKCRLKTEFDVDSAKMIDAIADLEASLIGHAAVNMYDLEYTVGTIYIQADEDFFSGSVYWENFYPMIYKRFKLALKQ